MSIPSIASNLDNISSAYFDPKQLRHLGSSEVFHSFLLNSPYTSPAKVSHQPTQQVQQRNSYLFRRTEETNQYNDDVLEYLSPAKRACIMLEPTSAILPRSKRYEEGESCSSMGYIDLCDIPATSKSVIKESVGESGEEVQGSAGPSINKQRKLRASQSPQGYNRGFECPDMESLDEKTRQFIEGLQERIGKLEGEVVKLKRDNHELSVQNKKHEDRMIAVVQEQEKIAKARGDYEKTIASLRDNCLNNQDIADSLKGILKLQEAEFYDRVVKKEQKTAKSMPNTRTTKSSVKLSQNKVCSVPSIEAILEPKEVKENNERKKSSIRVGTAKSVSKTSLTSVCTRKCNAASTSSKNDNCFMTTEVQYSIK